MPLIAGGRLPSLQTRKQSVLQVDNFNGGVNLLFSETRLKNNEAKEATNLILIEDGIWDKRPGTKTKLTMAATIDGHCEYVKSDGTTEEIIVAGGIVYKSTNLSTTTAITGATLTAGKQCYFIQIQNNLYITNGTDPITRYNGTSLVQYSALGAMGTVTLARGAGLSTGSYNYYYQVTAVNAVGETAPSAEATIAVNKDRDTWTAANETIDLSWAAVTGALKYIVYFSNASGYEVKLAEVTANSYSDNGKAVSNPYIAPPSADSTGGPKLSQMTISGNRLWGIDPNNPYRAWFSGTGVNLSNFNPGFGGGWVEIEKGGRATTIAVVDFQGKAHIICKTPDGRGNIWQVTLESQTISGTTFTVPIPTKIIGQVGASATLSAIIVENDVFFVNKKGVQILGNEPGVLNVLRTNEISAKVRPYFTSSISGDSVAKIASYYTDSKVFISVPTATGANNRTLIFDRERGVWIKDWDLGFSQFSEFTDSSGVTWFLGSNGTKLIHISSAYEDDDGTAFTWKFVSARIPVAKDWTKFAKIKRAYVRLRNTTGSISFSFSGIAKVESSSVSATGTITPASSDTGIGWDKIGTVKIGTTSGVPTAFQVESLIKYLIINKLIRDMQWTIQGSTTTARTVITGLMGKGFLIQAGEPADWQLS